jgi:hypothetical protein
LRSSARYVAANAQEGDVIALPDHAITSATEYYLSSENSHITQWPQLGTRQPYVEGFDLSVPRASKGGSARRVWLVNDGSVAGVDRFEAALEYFGYVLTDEEHFTGVTLLLYQYPRT